jgi:hypothetical protein
MEEYGKLHLRQKPPLSRQKVVLTKRSRQSLRDERPHGYRQRLACHYVICAGGFQPYVARVLEENWKKLYRHPACETVQDVRRRQQVGHVRHRWSPLPSLSAPKLASACTWGRPDIPSVGQQSHQSHVAGPSYQPHLSGNHLAGMALALSPTSSEIGVLQS